MLQPRTIWAASWEQPMVLSDYRIVNGPPSMDES